MTTHRSHHGPHIALLCLLALPACLTISTAPASAQLVVSGSPDIHMDQSGSFVSPGDVSTDIEVLMPALIDLGPLPDGADVIAYSPGFAPDDHFFVLEHTMTLPGGLTVRPRDVAQWDGAAYALVLDGRSNSIPDGTAIDAFTFNASTGSIWISFDTTVDLGGLLLRDADVLDGATGTLAFDSVAAGVPAGLDVDGVSQGTTADDVLLSFDVGGTIDGITFADEDVLRYDPNDSDPWTLAIDASTTDPDWEAADLEALHLVPEPALVSLLASGASALGILARYRDRRRASSTAPASTES